jgi:hypothetical protein
MMTRRQRAGLARHRIAAGMTRREGCHHHDQRPQWENKKMNNVLEHGVPLLDRNPRRNHVTPWYRCGTDR